MSSGGGSAPGVSVGGRSYSSRRPKRFAHWKTGGLVSASRASSCADSMTNTNDSPGSRVTSWSLTVASASSRSAKTAASRSRTRAVIFRRCVFALRVSLARKSGDG